MLRAHENAHCFKTWHFFVADESDRILEVMKEVYYRIFIRRSSIFPERIWTPPGLQAKMFDDFRIDYSRISGL